MRYVKNKKFVKFYYDYRLYDIGLVKCMCAVLGYSYSFAFLLYALAFLQAVKLTQLPNGTAPGYRNAQERLNKLREMLGKMEVLFQKLRVVYNECQRRNADSEQEFQLSIPLANHEWCVSFALLCGFLLLV